MALMKMDIMKSMDHVDSHERRLEAEIDQLCIDIRRIGPTYPDPEPHVLFGELFDDEQVEQYYEALVGTLKSAKKRGIISFKGQMLLKGAHDNVIISLVGESLKGETNNPAAPSNKLPDEEVLAPISTNTSISRPSSNSKSIKSAPQPMPKIVSKTHVHVPHQTNKNKDPPKYSYMSKPKKYVPAYTFNPPTRAKSVPFNSFSYSTTKPSNSSSTKPSNSPSTMQPSSPSKPQIPFRRATTCPSNFARTELSDRIEKEIPQLLKDIRRIGSPGEPYVRFGELFDDEEVEQYYEALVGTLKCAKKRGYISFRGQMLLKGMHDDVQIEIQKEF